MNTPETAPPAGGDDPGRGLSGAARAGMVLAALVVLAVVFVVLRGGGDDDAPSPSTAPVTTATPAAEPSPGTVSGPSASTPAPAKPAVATIRVVGGQPKGGVRTLTFRKGDRVAFEVRSDVADEIHVHGYDRMKDVAAGGRVRFSFPASIDGRFVVELEHAGTQIATLQVEPS